ncbi:MAG: hypothetical protein LIV24_03220 [Eubacterium sp.]|nr:hypothetical protein [Eubacterium sp.]
MTQSAHQFYQMADLLFVISGIGVGVAFFLGIRYRIWKMIRTDSEELRVVQGNAGENRRLFSGLRKIPAICRRSRWREKMGETDTLGRNARGNEEWTKEHSRSGENDEAETAELNRCAEDDDAETAELNRCAQDEDAETAELNRCAQDEDAETAELNRNVHEQRCRDNRFQV